MTRGGNPVAMPKLPRPVSNKAIAKFVARVYPSRFWEALDKTTRFALVRSAPTNLVGAWQEEHAAPAFPEEITAYYREEAHHPAHEVVRVDKLRRGRLWRVMVHGHGTLKKASPTAEGAMAIADEFLVSKGRELI